MAQLAFILPVPAGDGVGASVDTSAAGQEKTVFVDGTYQGAVLIEISNDGGASWAQIAGFADGQPGRKSLCFAAQRMRARRTGAPLSGAGTPTIGVGANDNGAQAVSLPAPAGNGLGAAVDISAFGSFSTVSVLGTFTGVVNILASEDGASFTTVMTFNRSGVRSVSFAAQLVRVERAGATSGSPGLPVVALGAENDPSSELALSARGSVLAWGNASVAASADTRFLFAGFSASIATLTPASRMRMPRAGVLRNFSVRHNAAKGNGNAVDYDVLVNGVPAGLGLSLVTGIIGAATKTNPNIPVAALDNIDVTATKALAIGAANIDVVFTAEFA